MHPLSKKILISLLVVAMSTPTLSFAQVRSSSIYKIQSDSINFAGGLGASATYKGESALGESSTGRLAGASYGLFDAGYLHPVAGAGSVSPTPAPTSGGSSPNSSHPIVVSSQGEPLFYIVPSDTSAMVIFRTNNDVTAGISWGTGGSYAAGSVTEVGYGTYHKFLIKNLTPNTTYTLRAVITTDTGRSNTYENIEFATLALPLSNLPLNVTSFSATARTNTIDLRWTLPNDSNVVAERLVRSTSFYPSTPEDGETIFSERMGSSESFVDTKVKSGVTYYYAIFTEDLAGNFSSGVIDSARILLLGEPAATSTPLDTIPDATDVDPLISGLTLANFTFSQDGVIIDPSDAIVTIDGNKNLKISLKYTDLPQVLKTIAVTLVTIDQHPKSFTFILRANTAKTRYEATIGSLGKTDSYRLKITIIDFKNQGLKKINGAMVVHSGDLANYSEEDINRLLAYLLVILILFAIAAYLFRTRHE
ncbi:MAG: fibronectin type III domain-containing protein [Patescibacteria group bacterium]